MKKKTKAPAKKAKPKTKAKAAVKAKKPARRRTIAVRTPKLVITVVSDCSLTNNQNLDPPHACNGSGGGFPNHVQFRSEVQAWICLPPGYLVPEPTMPLIVTPDQPSQAFRVSDSAPTGRLQFHHQCDRPCLSAHLNGDEIIINSIDG